MKKFFTISLILIFLNQNILVFATTLNGQVEDISNNIMVSQTELPLRSNLKKEYTAYSYEIQNMSKQDIQLVNAQIQNGTNGSVAIQNVTDGHPIGTTWAICGPIGLITLGIGWAVGLVATPVVWLVSSSNTKKVRNEAIAYSNIVNLGYLKTGESTSVNTLVPIGTKPQLKLTLQGQKSKDLIMINR